MNQMTADELCAIGQALYGHHWVSSLGFDLEVSDRSVRRWASGRADIPSDLREELRELRDERLREIQSVNL